MPPGSDGIEKVPLMVVTVLFSAPVPLFLIFTSAPGMTPPDESTTVPDSDVRKLPCARAGAPETAVRNNAAKIDHTRRRLIKNPPVISAKSTDAQSRGS